MNKRFMILELVLGIVLTCIGVLVFFKSIESQQYRCLFIPSAFFLASGLHCLALFLIHLRKQPKI
jgi:nitrogen fixation-related uncharacterized protein